MYSPRRYEVECERIFPSKAPVKRDLDWRRDPSKPLLFQPLPRLELKPLKAEPQWLLSCS